MLPSPNYINLVKNNACFDLSVKADFRGVFAVIQAGLNLAPVLIPALAGHFIGIVNQTVIKCKLELKSEWRAAEQKWNTLQYQIKHT